MVTHLVQLWNLASLVDPPHSLIEPRYSLMCSYLNLVLVSFKR